MIMSVSPNNQGSPYLVNTLVMQVIYPYLSIGHLNFSFKVLLLSLFSKNKKSHRHLVDFFSIFNFLQCLILLIGSIEDVRQKLFQLSSHFQQRKIYHPKITATSMEIDKYLNSKDNSQKKVNKTSLNPK